MVSTINLSNGATYIKFYNLFSIIYITLVMSVFVYIWDVYNIGKLVYFPLIAILSVTEFMKYLLVSAFNADKPKKKHRSKFKSLLLVLGMIVVYYVIAVLFGAAFLSNQEETLMFSLLLTVLTVVPSCLNLGFDTTVTVLTNLTTSQNDQLAECIRYNIFLTLFGAWLGAIVIPLDWDRAWQVWPIPCSYGAIVGNCCSHIIILLHPVVSLNRYFVKRTGKYGL